MSGSSSSSNAKVAAFIADVDLAHRVVHGGPTTVVQTEGGPVRSLANVMAGLDQSVNDAATSVIGQVISAKDQAVASAAQVQANTQTATAAASTASNKATDAARSSGEALSSASAAAGSATSASGSATAAASSAAAAAGSKTSAEAAAVSAQGSKAAAAASESAAGGSAAQALASKNAAAGSASSAADSATSANGSKVAAATSERNAQSSASAAATSAGGAASSATAAAESAAAAANSKAASEAATAIAQAAAAVAVNLPGTTATSASAITLGNGAKSFVLSQVGKAFALSQWVYIVDQAAPTARWMHGTVMSFEPSTGAMSVNVLRSKGDGAGSGWLVMPASPSYDMISETAGGAAIFAAKRIGFGGAPDPTYFAKFYGDILLDSTSRFVYTNNIGQISSADPMRFTGNSEWIWSKSDLTQLMSLSRFGDLNLAGTFFARSVNLAGFLSVAESGGQSGAGGYAGPARLGRFDRAHGGVVLQLGGADNNQAFEVVDRNWSMAVFSASMSNLLYKGSQIWHAANVNPLHTITGALPNHDANARTAIAGFTYNNNAGGVTGPLLSVGHPDYLLQMVANYNSGTDFLVRTRNGDGNAWNPWRKLWHDGNLNGAALMYDRGASTEDAAVVPGFYRLEVGGYSRSLLSYNTGGSTGTMQIMSEYQGRIWWRNWTDNRAWTAWKEFYHTGNFNPANFVTQRLQLYDGNAALTRGSDYSPRFETPWGWVEIGPKNTSACHIYSDSPKFYFNRHVATAGRLFGNGDGGTGLGTITVTTWGPGSGAEGDWWIVY